ncbi:DL-glycerol-3-phosphatase [Zalaria obscura]|uniref:DL-glycerol-3-phosphatase n=1 Tax=Zalaria obscura TaxID=2024903 RepID=A0ACC3S5K9_9PEZI
MLGRLPCDRQTTPEHCLAQTSCIWNGTRTLVGHDNYPEAHVDSLRSLVTWATHNASHAFHPPFSTSVTQAQVNTRRSARFHPYKRKLQIRRHETRLFVFVAPSSGSDPNCCSRFQLPGPFMLRLDRRSVHSATALTAAAYCRTSRSTVWPTGMIGPTDASYLTSKTLMCKEYFAGIFLSIHVPAVVHSTAARKFIARFGLQQLSKHVGSQPLSMPRSHSLINIFSYTIPCHPAVVERATVPLADDTTNMPHHEQHNFTAPAEVHSFSALLFDMDGTIIDSTNAIIKHWHQIGKEIGVDPNVILQTSHGRRTIDVLEILEPKLATWEYVKRAEGVIPQRYGQDAVEIPGARALLDQLEQASAPWAVVTSGTAPLVKGWFEVMKLTHPRNLVTAEDVKKGKPDPACYLLGAERLGLTDGAKEGRQILVLEDAPAGVRAGKAAGFKVVALATTHAIEQLVEAGADWIVEDMRSVTMSDFDAKKGECRIEIKDALVA